MITIEISLGEALDRFSILLIKFNKIKDKEKSALAKTQAESLQKLIAAYGDMSSDMRSLYDNLLHVNKELWDIEDDIRKQIKEQASKRHWYNLLQFATLAKQVPELNDKRAALKQQIDSIWGDTGEVKEYAE